MSLRRISTHLVGGLADSQQSHRLDDRVICHQWDSSTRQTGPPLDSRCIALVISIACIARVASGLTLFARPVAQVGCMCSALLQFEQSLACMPLILYRNIFALPIRRKTQEA
jgi:hypothetical protein